MKVEILRRDCPSRSPHFNPLRPCGRRPDELWDRLFSTRFQSTPPVWAETPGGGKQAPDRRDFNPLRPCGRRLYSPVSKRDAKQFQSTPPVWAETDRISGFFNDIWISIHSARVGGDSSASSPSSSPRHFNPLRPCGRRQQKKPFFRLLSISITTYFTEKSKRTRCKFSHLGYLFQYSLLILVRTSLYVDV